MHLFIAGVFRPGDCDTVDGQNPAPVDMINIPLFTGFYTSQVVRISSINSILALSLEHPHFLRLQHISRRKHGRCFADSLGEPEVAQAFKM